MPLWPAFLREQGVNWPVCPLPSWKSSRDMGASTEARAPPVIFWGAFSHTGLNCGPWRCRVTGLTMHQLLLCCLTISSGPCILVVPGGPDEEGAAGIGPMRHWRRKVISPWPHGSRDGQGKEKVRVLGHIPWVPPPSSFNPRLSLPLGGPGWLERTRVKVPGQFGGIQLEQVRCFVHDTRSPAHQPLFSPLPSASTP